MQQNGLEWNELQSKKEYKMNCNNKNCPVLHLLRNLKRFRCDVFKKMKRKTFQLN